MSFLPKLFSSWNIDLFYSFKRKGFEGSRCDKNISRKKDMLREEGVRFDDKGVKVDPSSVFKFINK